MRKIKVILSCFILNFSGAALAQHTLCPDRFTHSVDVMLKGLAEGRGFDNNPEFYNTLRLELYADRYDFLSKEQAFEFKKSAVEMGFSEKEIFQMLSNEEFARLVTEERKIKENSKQSPASVQTTHGLGVLKEIFGFRNEQIMMLAEIDQPSFRLTSLNTLEKKQVLEDNLGLSPDETFEFFIRYVLNQSSPFNYFPSELKRGEEKLKELGLDNSQIRTALKASVLELAEFPRLVNKNKLSLEHKRDLLRKAGLSERTVNLIPDELLTVPSKETMLSSSAMIGTFSLWGGIIYWLFD